MFKSLRIRLAEQSLKKPVGKTRITKGHNFNTAKSVGIITWFKEESVLKETKALSQYLRGEHGIRTVRILGYVAEKEKDMPDWAKGSSQIETFNKQDLNLRLKPAGVKDFVSTEFDILLSIESDRCIPLEYIKKHSSARMIVGRPFPGDFSFLDLSIEIESKESTQVFLDQAKNILTTFNLT